MRRITIIAFSLLFFAGCGSALRNLTPAEATPAERELLDRNWQLGEYLAAYDRYSWIASDSAMAHYSEFDSGAVRGWVLVTDSTSERVVFGKIAGDTLISCYQVYFRNGEPQNGVVANISYTAPSEEFVNFKVMDKMREKYRDEFQKLNVRMNSYVISQGDTLAVYFFPGATDRYLVFCGGYRSYYSRSTLELIQHDKLHGSPLVVEPQPDAVALTRTSSRNDVMNEVDIAQFLILRAWAPKQYILTSKYIYILSWDASADKPIITTMAGKQ